MKRCVLLGFIISFNSVAVAQSSNETEKQAPPPLQMTRASENYAYLKDRDASPYRKGLFDEVKYIPLSSDRASYLTLGGGFRPRFEHYTNRGWSEGSETYYTQRISVHAGLQFGTFARVFGELYHGYNSDGEAFLTSEEIDFHQGFIEVLVPVGTEWQASLLFGRRELSFGASRLVGIREGPNMRRSFDLLQTKVVRNKAWVLAFYGKEVQPQFNAFDNAFSLFDDEAANPQLWGMYSQLLHKWGNNEFYYLGFQSDVSRFNDVAGKETRHSIGLRRFGSLGERWRYNTEVIYQFGDIAGQTIRAFNTEADWSYTLVNTTMQPMLGLKFDLSTGDRESGDGKIETFNPLFVNPGIYSLAALNTPANLWSLHPSITLYPASSISLKIEYAFFYRTTKADGLYTPPRFQSRMGDGVAERHIGDTIGLNVNYSMNRNLSFSLVSSYFFAGQYLEVSGDAESTFYLASTVSFNF